MAMKRRVKATAAEIEAFGDAADQPHVSNEKNENAAAATATVPQPRETQEVTWPAGLPKTFLIRWADPNLVYQIEDMARIEERSKHQTVLRALERGLQVMRLENEK